MVEWTRFAQGTYSFAVAASQDGIRTIDLHGREPSAAPPATSNPILRQAVAQLRAYFGGELRAFDLPLDLQGTAFQKRVWEELLRIPYGETCSYRDLAHAIGSPKAVRAVGAANGANPVPIVVPCHRVIGAGGSLVGYGGGLPLKRYLLDLEARHTGLFQ